MYKYKLCSVCPMICQICGEISFSREVCLNEDKEAYFNSLFFLIGGMYLQWSEKSHV